MAKQNFKISKAIEGKYEVVNTSYPCLESRIGFIDFRYITLDQAERLMKAGTKYLKKVRPKPAAPETAADDKEL